MNSRAGNRDPIDVLWPWRNTGTSGTSSNDLIHRNGLYSFLWLLFLFLAPEITDQNRKRFEDNR